MGESKWQVENWDPTKESPSHLVRADPLYLPAGLWGLTGTLLVHLLLIRTFFFAGGMTAIPSHKAIQGAPDSPSNSAAADLVLIDIRPAGAPTPCAMQAADCGLSDSSLKRMVSLVPSPPTPTVDIPVDPSDARAPESASGEEAVENSRRERMVGIYSGQIRARIERIWRRPKAPVDGETDPSGEGEHGAEAFQCLVTILQDSAGRVQETDILRCNGTAAWQRSLVIAINQASPLPAPPDPKIFARALTLSFVGVPFEPGMPTDEYER